LAGWPLRAFLLPLADTRRVSPVQVSFNPSAATMLPAPTRPTSVCATTQHKVREDRVRPAPPPPRAVAVREACMRVRARTMSSAWMLRRRLTRSLTWRVEL
jgi:hypothetical protein